MSWPADGEWRTQSLIYPEILTRYWKHCCRATCTVNTPPSTDAHIHAHTQISLVSFTLYATCVSIKCLCYRVLLPRRSLSCQWTHCRTHASHSATRTLPQSHFSSRGDSPCSGKDADINTNKCRFHRYIFIINCMCDIKIIKSAHDEIETNSKLCPS